MSYTEFALVQTYSVNLAISQIQKSLHSLLGVMVSIGSVMVVVWRTLLFVTQLFLSTHILYNKDFLYRLETTLLSPALLSSSVPVHSLILAFSHSCFMLSRGHSLSLSRSFFVHTDLPRLAWVLIFQALRLHLKQKQNYGSGLARGEHIDPGMWFSSDQREVRWGEEFV